MKLIEIIKQRTHVHYFGPWKSADKGLAAIFNGELDAKTIQYRVCLDETCCFKQGKAILGDINIDVSVSGKNIGELSVPTTKM